MEYNEGKEGIRKVIRLGILIIFLFLLAYLVFWTKGLYKGTNSSLMESKKQTKNCVDLTYDVRNIYYTNNTLKTEFYLMGFSTGTVDTIYILSDRYETEKEMLNQKRKSMTNEQYTENLKKLKTNLLKSYTFKRPVKPGETRYAEFNNVSIDKTFITYIAGCPTYTTKSYID